MTENSLPAQAILFDIGNVLLKFDYNRAASAMAAHSTADPARIRAALEKWTHQHETGVLSSEAFGEAVGKDIGYTAPEELFREQFCRIFEANEPMWDFARRCFGKVPVYLFSNISEWHEMWCFENYPDFARFDGGFYSWRMGTMKPESAFYHEALATLPFDPDRIAYMDDMPLNVAGGKSVGFRAVQYSYADHAGFLTSVAGWLE